jgi:hypothetical protein
MMYREHPESPTEWCFAGLDLDTSGLRDAHGIGRDSLSSRSGDSGLADAWDPASPVLPHMHSQEQLKQAISQVTCLPPMLCHGVLTVWGSHSPLWPCRCHPLHSAPHCAAHPVVAGHGLGLPAGEQCAADADVTTAEVDLQRIISYQKCYCFHQHDFSQSSPSCCSATCEGTRTKC